MKSRKIYLFKDLYDNIRLRTEHVEDGLENDPLLVGAFTKEFNRNVSNNNKTKVPIVCPKCGSMIALIDNGSKVGCSKYPQCNYVVWKDN